MKRVEIHLSADYLERAASRAKKNKRSRKAELENIIRVELDKEKEHEIQN